MQHGSCQSAQLTYCFSSCTRFTRFSDGSQPSSSQPSSSSDNPFSKTSNNSNKKKRINAKQALKRSSTRTAAYNLNRIQLIYKFRLHFGLSEDTKIIIANNENIQINLKFGKVAVFNSSGTDLICSVEFHHLSSHSGSGQHLIQSRSAPAFQSINFDTLDDTDPETLDQHIQNLDRYLSSVRLNPHLISSNFCETFPILYQHALSRNPVKTNSAMNRMGSNAQGKMFAIGYRSEAMVGKHQRPNKHIGKNSFLSNFF